MVQSCRCKTSGPVRCIFHKICRLRAQDPESQGGRLLAFPAPPENHLPLSIAPGNVVLPGELQVRTGQENLEEIFPGPREPGMMYLSFSSFHHCLERAAMELNRLQELDLLRALSLMECQCRLREFRQAVDSEVLERLNHREKEDLLSFAEVFGRVQAKVARDDRLETERRREATRQKTKVHVHRGENAARQTGPQAPPRDETRG